VGRSRSAALGRGQYEKRFQNCIQIISALAWVKLPFALEEFVTRIFCIGLLFALAILATNISCFAQSEEPAPPPPDASDLAKETQNPVSSVVSIPFQFNFNTGGGYGDKTGFNLNVQPVMPFKVSANWNLIARTIVPILSLPLGDGRTSGVGDIQEQIFFSPAKPGRFIWGLGPIFSLPTATVDAARTGAWAAGPNALILKMAGPYVFGALMNQAWTFSDDGGDPEVNQFLIQPFLNFNFGKGWAIATGPSITANWDAPDGEKWTVPLGLGITHTVVFAKRPMTIGFQFYHNVERPTGAAANQIRLILTLIYPGGH
jgi:hypothetical protein